VLQKQESRHDAQRAQRSRRSSRQKGVGYQHFSSDGADNEFVRFALSRSNRAPRCTHADSRQPGFQSDFCESPHRIVREPHARLPGSGPHEAHRSGIPVCCRRVPGNRSCISDGINSAHKGTSPPDMYSTLFNRRRRELVTSILLVTLVLRALIPAGFMPASGEGFSLTICRAEFPAPSSHDTGRHPGNPPHTEHCAFGNAPAAGPAMEVARVLPTAVTAAEPIVLSEPLRINVELVRVQQPRGPPRFA
jgi:hypothetical protein